MSLKSFLILVVLVFSTSLSGQAQSEPGFRLGVVNERPDRPDHVLNQYEQLHLYLERELEPKGYKPIELVIARSLNEMVDLIINGKVDALIEGVMPTFKIEQRGGELEPALLVWRKGQRQYHSVFFVRKDSGITTLDNVRGKSIAFEAPRSTSAFFVPKAELQAAGVAVIPADTTERTLNSVYYMFAGSELNQAYWVHRKRVDVGAFNNGDWERIPPAIKSDLKIIHHTRPILRWLLSFTPSATIELQEAVIETLLSAHGDEMGQEALAQAEHIKKFERISSTDQENLKYWKKYPPLLSVNDMFQKLNTKYSLLFATLLLGVTFLILGLSGYLVLQRTNELRTKLVQSFTAIYTSQDMDSLRSSGTYLSSRLFNPLYNFDIQTLNEELKQAQSWLKPRVILVLDQDGKVVTDGTVANERYGQLFNVPQLVRIGKPHVEFISDGKQVYFAIGFGGNIVGYAFVEFSSEKSEQLLQVLSNSVADTWGSFYKAFSLIAFLSGFLVIVISVLIGWRLSKSLSRPLREMIDAAEHYASGKLDYRITKRSDDELGRLSNALNTMADDLFKAGNLLNRAQEMASFGSWEWRRAEEDLTFSIGIYKILGLDNQAFPSTVENFLKFVVPEMRRRVSRVFRGEYQKSTSDEFQVSRADGATRVLFIQSELTRTENGTVIGSHGTIQDITEQKRSHEQLQKLANYDNLTGLPNRHLFYDRLSQALKKAKRREKSVALLFLDLDRFKSINDALGHGAGDELLCHVAKRLRRVVRGSDTLARMGGDEFTLIIDDFNTDIGGPQKVAQNIIKTLTPPFIIAHRELFISTSIGIALYPQDAQDIDSLVKNADTAMYLAKEQGKAEFRFFTPDLDKKAHERLALEHQLRQAVDQSQFELHYQPQVSSSSEKLVAVEALLRWRRGNEFQSPAKFIPSLVETGLITRLTEPILNEACLTLKRLHQGGLTGLRMCVNLSATQFQQLDLLEHIDTALNEHELEPQYLEVEITEHTLLDREASQNNAAALGARGIRLAIDDFGTGYSSLTYLKQLDISVLKIDRSFVRDMCNDPEDAQIIAALVGLAHNLGIDCIAEGVEEQQQFEQLREFGCDILQGFLFSPALPYDELLVWINRNSSNRVFFDLN